MVKDELFVRDGITIPENEIEITTSRAGGPGGQHINKTDTRITARWNVRATNVLDDQQKERVLHKLQNQLTSDGDIVIHNSTSRSQQQNKKMALKQLSFMVRQALHVPKKRMATKISRSIKESRLYAKKHRSAIKKMRGKAAGTE